MSTGHEHQTFTRPIGRCPLSYFAFLEFHETLALSEGTSYLPRSSRSAIFFLPTEIDPYAETRTAETRTAETTHD